MMRHFQYLKYLCRHKWFVWRAGRLLKVPVLQLLLHDWSKLRPSEWLPYARYFYDERGRPRTFGTQSAYDKYEFDLAWLHHLRRNSHHWQHWLLAQDEGVVRALRMPNNYVREMVADWAGAGKAINGEWEFAKWYAERRDTLVLHPETRYWVDFYVGKLQRIVRNMEES